MKKLFLLLIPITLITLCGCSDDTISQRVYDLENTQDMLIQRVEIIEIDQIDKGVIETTSSELCVGLTDITVATYQAKDVFECIGNGEGYCNCIEKYASCGKRLSDIPVEYRNDFNPACFNN